MLDGEIVCLDEAGNSQFQNLLFRRGEPRFYAFDLLWCYGEDLRYLTLTDRKQRLLGIVPPIGERLLYCDHVEGMGEELFQLACERDRAPFRIKKHKKDHRIVPTLTANTAKSCAKPKSRSNKLSSPKRKRDGGAKD